MHKFFINIYNALKKAGWRLGMFLIPLLVLIGYSISELQIEEDISALIPMDERIFEMGDDFINSNFADQIVFNIYFEDTATTDPHKLIEVVDSLSAFLTADTTFVKNVRSSIDESAFRNVYNYFYRYLPYYLSDAEYKYLDTILNEEHLNRLMLANYKSIISPTGFGTGKYILKDPLSLVPRCLEKLKSFQLDDNFTTFQSHIFTKDKKHAMCFVDPVYSSKNTKANRHLISSIDNFLKDNTPEGIEIDYYGGTAVAVANSNRIQNDITLTVGIAIFLLILLFIFVFKKFRILFVLFVPVVFGVGISVTVLSFMYDTLSAISLGVGAILLGISIDYSLHYFSHARLGHSPKSIIKSIADPIIMSSLTTASAFFCLYVMQSKALNQLGLFAGFSVIATSILVLIGLPLLFKKNSKSTTNKEPRGIFDKIASYNFDTNKYLMITVLILSLLFFIAGKWVKFDADIAHVNYLSEDLKKAEDNLNKISAEASSVVFIMSKGKTIDEAIAIFDSSQTILDSLQVQGIIKKISSPNTLLITQKAQQEKKQKWLNFWKRKGVVASIDNFNKAAVANHFKENSFSSFYSLLTEDIPSISNEDLAFMRKLFLNNHVHENGDIVKTAALIKVDPSKKDRLFAEVSKLSGLLILDKKFYIDQFFIVLKDDFSKLINYSMIVVFIIVLIFWGRFELTVITFTPIALSWYWTIGLMSLLGIQFNIFNIIICTFIFGLGIDYSIFLTQGMINDHKYGTKSLIPYKVSILLSMTTTLIGVGVLIFAQHPALKSIALVTVLGILSVVIITFTVLPFLFRVLIYNKGQKRVFPIILLDVIVSLSSFIVFLVGVIVLTVMTIIFKWTPFFQKAKKQLIHYLLHQTSKLVVCMNVLFKRTYIDRHKFDLSKPAVIVSNHQSHLDIVLILMLNPKIIILTNQWVWKNPFYGFIIRYIDFYPIYTGIEKGYSKIQQKVEQGYSVLIFPEGTRTKDGSINRFHQGAFSLADTLGLDILPVLIHGAYECLPKTEFFLRSGHITLKFFDRIKVIKPDLEKGITYRPQAKEVRKFYREQYDIVKNEKETVDFYARRLINMYVYKGPVLEWYLRVKLSLEKNYKFFDNLLPAEGKIIDVGCGYGFMLNILKLTQNKRELIGWDYDEDKITVALSTAKGSGITFEVKDVVTAPFEPADVFIFNDVLHYFNHEKKIQVLQKAVDSLSLGGKIVIRDADSSLKERTKVTKLTEWWSIKALGFNKMKYELEFLSTSMVSEFSKQHNLKMERLDNAKYTSNVIFILTKLA